MILSFSELYYEVGMALLKIRAKNVVQKHQNYY